MNITGRITRDAVVRTTATGKQVVNFSIGIRHRYKNKEGEKINEDTFFDCSYWRTPNIAPYLTKGTVVELSGRISPSAWIDKQGNLKAGLNFRTSEIEFHGGSAKTEATGQITQKPASNAPVKVAESDDDLPF